MAIEFGTSEWRAVIADEFTFAGGRSVTGAICSNFGSVASSHLVGRVAEARGLPVHETPVGFKYIGELINENKIVIGGEESAGLSIQGHYPEKDGILACLLAAEAVAARGTSLTEQLNDLYARVRKLESGRTGIRLTPDLIKALPDKLKQYPKRLGAVELTTPSALTG